MRPAEDATPSSSVADWDVVFFSSVDFSSHMQRAQAVALELAARGARVLFVDNLGLRFPRLDDRSRVVHRVRAALRRRRGGSATERETGITVLSPIVPPLEHWQPVRHLTRRWLRSRVEAWALPPRRMVVWTYLPNPVVADLAGALRAGALVYEYADLASVRLKVRSERHRRRVERWEENMLGQADAVFAPTPHLLAARGVTKRSAFVVQHGVLPTIARAEPATELEAWPRPRVVFVGSISSVVDVALLDRLAATRPDWSFVLIGPARAGLGSLTDRANVLLAGERPHDQIPGLLAACDVGLIPYRLDVPGIGTVSPLKLREYRAQGLPVVSVDIPDVREHAPDVVVADGVDGFVAAIEEAIRRGRGQNREERLWSAAVDEMIRHLDELGCPRTADAL